MRISDWSSDVCSSDLHADAVEAGAFLQESLGVVGIEDRGYQALGAANLLDRDLDIGWRAGIATVFRGLGLAAAEGAVEVEEKGEGGRRRAAEGDKTQRVVTGENVEHGVGLSACDAQQSMYRNARHYDPK